METLIEIYQRLLREMIPTYKRKFYDEFVMDSRLVGVIGARGVGKTTFLIEYLRTKYSGSSQTLYISADNLYFVEHTLVDVIDEFVKHYNGTIICIDEIHKYKNWDQELKNIYDSYPNLQIIFSGSSSIDLIKGKYDLSRRAILKNMYGFSFREFLEIKENKSFPIIDFSEIIANHQLYEKEFSAIPKLLGYLKEYLKEGYYPTRFELQTSEAYIQSLRNIVDKIVYEDISSFYSLNTQNLDTLKKIIYFFATSLPGKVNTNSIANSLGKDHTTIASYIQLLRDSGVLRFLLVNKSGHALVRNAEKIYLDNTNLLYALNEEIGKEPFVGVLRELFVISNLQNINTHVFYSQEGDIEVNDITLEIGGKNKSSEQIKNIKNSYLIKDDILVGNPTTIPLYLFGFLS
ncbi:MAG TPA: AAA family ATPase [Candidatus Saccharimonadales bacterium]|nr:AAA family ATPase [Candidatus Saccharimonadales bacterium]